MNPAIDVDPLGWIEAALAAGGLGVTGLTQAHQLSLEELVAVAVVRFDVVNLGDRTPLAGAADSALALDHFDPEALPSGRMV